MPSTSKSGPAAKPGAKKSGPAARPRPGSNRKPSPRRGPGMWLWIGLGVIVAIFVVIVVATRGSDAPPDPVKEGEAAPVTVTGTALPRFSRSGADPAIGMTAPDVSGKNFDGKPVSIANDGQAKVVVFGAHWCPHCQIEVPKIVTHLESDPMPSDVGLYFVATGTDPAAPNYPPSAWLEREKWPGVELADSLNSDAATAFGLPSYPYFVAIDSQGTVVARTVGELTTEQFDALVQAAQTGTPITGA